MQTEIITTIFASIWIVMRTFYYPQRGSDLLYCAIARPSLMAALIWPLAGGTFGNGDFFSALIFAYAVGSCLYLALTYFGIWYTSQPSGGQDHRRGANIIDHKELAKLTTSEPGHAHLGQARIPARVEPLHFLLAGATGSGKTQAFLQLAGSARERGHAAIVADVGGEFTKRFYQPARGDVILNPADARGPDWSPLAEMRSEMDADRIAKSMIPDSEGSGSEWQHYSQTLLAAVLQRLYQTGGGTNREIVRLCTIASTSELSSLVAGLPAQALFDEGASRMLSSIRAIVSTYVKPLAWCNPEAGEDAFSVRRHVEEERKGWIFMTAREDQLASLRPLIAAQVDVAISSLLTLEPSDTRRLWFLLDEFASFNRIQGIEPLLTKGRKFGGVGVLGLQSISQVREVYGDRNAQTLLSCLGTWLTLRAQDAETAEYMSKYIGDEEVRRVTVSTGHSDSGTSTNYNEQIATQRAIMPAELSSLPDRVGILNIVGAYPAGAVEVPVSSITPSAPAFVQRERRPLAIEPEAA